MKYDVEGAKQILNDYNVPSESIDIGNVYYAATQLEAQLDLYQKRIKELESEVSRLKVQNVRWEDTAREIGLECDEVAGYRDSALALNEKLIAALEKAKADQTQLAKNYAPDEPMHRESWMHEAHGRIDDALAEARKDKGET